MVHPEQVLGDRLTTTDLRRLIIGVVLGKTLLARACAKQTDAVFLKLAAPQLVQMFIGDGAKVGFLNRCRRVMTPYIYIYIFTDDPHNSSCEMPLI